MKLPVVIAIDGTAASGKGTLARLLSREMHMAVLDTGALYRWIAKKIMDDGKKPEDEGAAVAIAQGLTDGLRLSDLADSALRTDEVGQVTSKIAAYPGVRAALLSFQRSFAVHPPLNSEGNRPVGAILDGRDIGTVVCPDADIKFYVTADVEIRAKRRHKELQSVDNPVTYEAVLADMRERDARDSGRKAAPMKPADDAIVLDTSHVGIDDVLNMALSHIGERLGENIS